MSTLFLRTLREDPADAEVPSHKLLVRAGYIRRAAPGIYSWLPLGYLTYRNVERIVRQEMDAAGFQEVHFPALLPREPYEVTRRWTEYGDNLFRLKDRKGNDMLLGPTHEEMFTLLVKDLCSSYKDLPLSIYQIQTKYRDEARPRAGLLRGREFVMKDSYSFDVDDAGLERSYDAHREAYIRTFDRLGLTYVIVSAMSGAMGGSKSEEFLQQTPVGEDTFVRCSSCGYAANVEAMTTPVPDTPADVVAELIETLPVAHVEDTPGTPTIETLVDLANAEHPRADGRRWTAADTLKNVVVMIVAPDGTRTPLVVGLPGDREVDLKRLEAAVAPAEVDVFGDADFEANPALVKGYIGPCAEGKPRAEGKPGAAGKPGAGGNKVLGESGASGIRYLLDPRVVDGTAWITGANEPGRHVFELVAGRDFTADGVVEAAEVREGDTCPRCGSAVHIARGIEIGHIFQLGRKYAEALDLKVLDEHGRLVTVTMGSYGLGVSRTVAAVVESTYDELGLCWPREVAPADVHIVATGKDHAVFAAAGTVAAELEASGVRVLYDDRPKVSPGVKFKDSELIGVPTIVVVGKGLAEGTIEIKDRRSGEREHVPVGQAVGRLIRIVHGTGHGTGRPASP